MKRFCTLILLSILVAGAVEIMGGGGFIPSASAEEIWKTEFDRLCGQSENAADMSADELKQAIEKCDALKPQIEALEATPRKVYLKRLQMCRNLFTYLLEGKEKK